ncbi:MAG: hypothetical protein ABIY55_10075 [Kofleriaceae bacterium]
MSDLDGRRGTVRIGVILLGASLVMASLALLVPFEGASLLGVLPVCLLALLGLGLVRNTQVARVLTGLLLLACVVLAPISTIRLVAASAAQADLDAAWFLSSANALATTLLTVWLCLRGIQQLLGRAPRTILVTARIVGGVLAVIAVSHLWIAAQVGFAWGDSWSMRISIDGTSLFGFPGWPLWYLVALVLGLVLLVGPRAVLARAATALLALFVALVPLVLVTTLETRIVAFQLVSLGVMLLPIYLVWWLREQLRVDASGDPATGPRGAG